MTGAGDPLELLVAEPGQRLDAYLTEHVQGLSRSALKQLIQDGHVLVNGQVAKPGQRLRLDDLVQCRLPEPQPVPETALPQAHAGVLDILYEDDDLIALNKGVGVVVHPAPGHRDDTLVNRLLAARPELSLAGLDPMRPGVVHRLDRDTTGVLLVAKSVVAQDDLLRQFRERTVSKLYLGLAQGRLQPDHGAIDAPIGRDPHQRQRMAVVDSGRSARTEYHLLAYGQGVSLVRAKLVTGRTHQIRVHLAAVGHPVIGDALYGGASLRSAIPRQMLHAWRLELLHPVRGDLLRVEAPLPPDIRRVASRLDLNLDEALAQSDVWR